MLGMISMIPSHMSLRAGSARCARPVCSTMGSMACYGREEAEEGLSAIDESSNVFSSFAKQYCSERGHKRVLAEEFREATV